MIEIKDINSEPILRLLPGSGSRRKVLLMKEDYISVKFSLAKPVWIPVGASCEIPGVGLFEVSDIQKPVFSTSNGGYDYTLRMDAHYWKWRNKIFFYTSRHRGKEASWTLTGTLKTHLGIFVDNLQALGYTYKGRPYKFEVDSTVEDTVMLITYDNTNMLDALTKMAQAWGCEWWVEADTIWFGRCVDNSEPFDISLYDNAEDMKATESKNTYATRIYVFGSTRNLPVDYRESTDGLVVDGVVQRRLMLPEGIPYLDAEPDLSEDTTIDAIVVFDHIYPRTNGHVDSVEEYSHTAEGESGEEIIETFYRFRDGSFTFSKDYLLEGQELHVQFLSGSLNGLDFGVKFNPEDLPEKNGEGTLNAPAQLFEVVANETYGIKLPNGSRHPEAGDTYVLYGWNSTKLKDMGLVGKAEKELLEAGNKWLEKAKIDPNTYTCPMMSDWIYNAGKTSDNDFIFPHHIGKPVMLVNDAFFAEGRRLSRIIGIEYDLCRPWDTPVYTVGESTSYSRLNEMEEKIEALSYAGQTYNGASSGSGVYVLSATDTTPPSDRNVFSALRSLQEFLSKKRDDTAKGNITFAKDIRVNGRLDTADTVFREFVSGWLDGIGARMWRDDNGETWLEFDNGRFRNSMETMSLRFNRVDVVSGELWNTVAFGTITKVDTERQVLWVDLVDDEMITSRPGDINRGIFHNLEAGAVNNTSSSADECGFQNIVGFTTSYFSVKSLTQDGKGFTYSLCPGSGHPRKGMKFACYGSFTDKERQSSTVSNRTRLTMLEGVNTWKIKENNIVYVRGDLNGMTINGHTFTGHGTIQRNSYIFGSQIFLTDKQKEELSGQDAYSVVLSDYEGVVNVDATGAVTNLLIEPYNVTDNEETANIVNSGKNIVTRGYALRSTIQAFRGNRQLHHDTLPGVGSYSVSLRCSGCSAQVTNGVLEITEVTDPAGAKVALEVNCEGEAVFNKEYVITAVRNGSSSVTLDLDNEMDSIACDSQGAWLFGKPVTNVRMRYGTKLIDITSVKTETTAALSVTKAQHKTDMDSRWEISVDPSVAGNASNPERMEITITATAKLTGDEWAQEREVTASGVFTIVKTRSTSILNLMPSSDAIKVTKGYRNERIYTTKTIECDIRRSDRDSVSILASPPEGHTLKFKADSGAETIYSGAIDCEGRDITQGIEFLLYKGAQLIDRETVPVVEDGNNAENHVTADLDNEMDAIAVDSQGVPHNPSEVKKTTIRMYYGDTEMSLVSAVVAGTDGICTPIWAKSVDGKSIEVSFTSWQTSKAPLSVFHIQCAAVDPNYPDTVFTRVCRFTVNRISGTAVHQLMPSVGAIKIGKDSRNNPVWATEKISCSVVRCEKSGTYAVTALPEGYTMTVTIDSGAATAYTPGSEISVKTATKGIGFSLLYQGATVDKETVPVVIDGDNGSANFRCDMDNEMDCVMCAPDGVPYPGQTVTAHASAWYGSARTPITKLALGTVPGLTAAAEVSEDRLTGTVNVTAFPAGDDIVRLPVYIGTQYNGTSWEGEMTLTLTRAIDTEVLQLQPGSSFIKQDKNGVKTPAKVTCSVIRRRRDGVAVLTSPPEGASIRCRIDSGQWQSYPAGGVPVSECTKGIDFELLRDGTVLDRENVPVVADGKDGNRTSHRFTRLATQPPTPQGVDCVCPIGSTSWSAQPPMTPVSLPLWMTEATFDQNGDLSGVWSEPVRISGEDGADGKNGKDGDYTEYIFCAHGTKPATPTILYVSGFRLNGYVDNQGYRWYDSPTDSTSRWWMSKGVISSSELACMDRKWSEPIPVTGEDGEDAEAWTLIINPKVVSADLPKTQRITVEVFRQTGSKDSQKLTSLPSGVSVKYSRNQGAKTAATASSSGWHADCTAATTSLEFFLTQGEAVLAQSAVEFTPDGITSVTQEYMFTVLNNPPAAAHTDWATMEQRRNNGSLTEPSDQYPHMWRKTITAWLSGKVDNLVELMQIKGQMGLSGCVSRVWDGFNIGQTYRNDTALTDPTVVRYIDYVAEENDGTQSGYEVHQCVTTGAYASGDESDASKWKIINNGGDTFFNSLLARNAHIRFLSGMQFIIMDSSNTETAGMTGDTGAPVIWAGATAQNRGNAPYRVYGDGEVYAYKLHLRSSENNKHIDIDPSSNSIRAFDSDGEESMRISGDSWSRGTLINQGGSASTPVNITSANTYSSETTANIGSRFHVGDNAKVKFRFRLKTQITQNNTGQSPNKLKQMHSVALRLVISRYASQTSSSPTSTVLIGSNSCYASVIGETMNSDGGDRLTTISLAEGYYQIQAQVLHTPVTLGTDGCSFSATLQSLRVDISYENLMTRYFKQGWFLSKDTENYAYAMWDSERYIMGCSNSSTGWKVDPYRIYAKQRGMWGQQLIMVFVATIYFGNKTKEIRSWLGGEADKPTVTFPTTGKCKVTFQSSWEDLGLQYAIVMTTSSGGRRSSYEDLSNSSVTLCQYNSSGNLADEGNLNVIIYMH